MKKILLLCTIATACFSQAGAQTTWKKLTIKFNNGLDLNDVYVHGDHIMAVGTYTDFQANKFIGQILKSDNGGQSWDTMQNTSGWFYKTIAFKDAETGFIGGYGSTSFMLKTTDGGKTWKEDMVDYDHAGITDMHFLTDKVGIAVGYGEAQFFSGNSYKTTDGGKTWVPSEHVDDSLPLQNMFFVNENLGYAVASFFGFTTFAKTTDGGAHWALEYTHSNMINDIYFWSATDGILVDYSGVYKTYDGGKTWLDKTTPVVKNKYLESVTFYDRFTGFAVGLSGVIFRTTDGGETWTKDLSPTTQNLSSVEIHEGKVYAVGSNGVVLRLNETLGLPEAKPELKATVYPNPASSELFVTVAGKSGTQMQLTLMDLSGRIITSGINTPGRLDISTIPAGLYILEVKTGDGVAREKVIVSR
jgi:photosystem II stability/assembly factor-like uncharacterized protein